MWSPFDIHHLTLNTSFFPFHLVDNKIAAYILEGNSSRGLVSGKHCEEKFVKKSERESSVSKVRN